MNIKNPKSAVEPQLGSAMHAVKMNCFTLTTPLHMYGLSVGGHCEFILHYSKKVSRPIATFLWENEIMGCTIMWLNLIKCYFTRLIGEGKKHAKTSSLQGHPSTYLEHKGV